MLTDLVGWWVVLMLSRLTGMLSDESVDVVLVLRRCDSRDMYSRRDSGASNERGVKGAA